MTIKRKKEKKKRTYDTHEYGVWHTWTCEMCTCVCAHCFCSFRDSLVDLFKYIFSVFKRYYTYFYIFFHLHVFLHIFLNNKTHVSNTHSVFST